VQFQLLSRQNFNVTQYNKLYNKAFVAAGFPLGYQGGWGPPLNYSTGMDPDGNQWTAFLGGNPDVTPLLMGRSIPASPQEHGWKDTFVMMPGQVTSVIVRWAPTDANASGHDYFEFDPSGGPGYVWHCHIIDHEDNEMMRPTHVYASLTAPPGRLDAPIYTGYQTVHPDAALFPVLAANAPPEEPKLETAESTPGRPTSFNLGRNYPNPFNPATTIRYDIAAAGKASLIVFEVSGSVVRTLVDGWREPGVYREVWDGRSGDGRVMPSGVYFYTLKTREFEATQKMVMLK
jgi:hypothetical protein